jgi:membrane protein DedA with SNARE-associated domain
MGAPRGNQLPWEGRAERADMVLMGLIVFSGAYGLLLLPAVPSLVGTHPVLLELFRGSMTSMVTMGALARVGEASLVVAVLAAIPGSMMFDWLYWWAGRRWGHRALALFVGTHPRARRRMDQAERISRRWGWLAVATAYLLPIPSVLVYAAVGWTGMRLRTFLLWDLVGALLWIGMLVGLGYAIGQRAVDVAHAVSHYALALTILLVVVIVARQMWRARREGGEPAPEPELP